MSNTLAREPRTEGRAPSERAIGILAIQGGYQAHAKILQQLGLSYCFVTRVEHLANLDGLILPGGESTTLLHFITQNGLFDAIKVFAKTGKPIFGTCAGAILLATHVTHPEQPSLGLIHITVERNAYGRQNESHISQGIYLADKSAHEMVFIRAPRIRNLGNAVTTIAECEGDIVCVQQGNCYAATYHPELSGDTSLHQLIFL